MGGGEWGGGGCCALAVRATCTGSQVERTEELLSRLRSSTCPARCLVCASVLFHLEQNVSADSLRHRLNGYLAKWVPSPPGKHTFENFTMETRLLFFRRNRSAKDKQPTRKRSQRSLQHDTNQTRRNTGAVWCAAYVQVSCAGTEPG